MTSWEITFTSPLNSPEFLWSLGFVNYLLLFWGKKIYKTLKEWGKQVRKEERKRCVLQLALTTSYVTNIKGHFCAFNPYLICYEAFGSASCHLISHQISDDNLNSRFGICSDVIYCKQYFPDRFWTCTHTSRHTLYAQMHTDKHTCYTGNKEQLNLLSLSRMN